MEAELHAPPPAENGDQDEWHIVLDDSDGDDGGFHAAPAPELPRGEDAPSLAWSRAIAHAAPSRAAAAAEGGLASTAPAGLPVWLPSWQRRADPERAVAGGPRGLPAAQAQPAAPEGAAAAAAAADASEDEDDLDFFPNGSAPRPSPGGALTAAPTRRGAGRPPLAELIDAGLLAPGPERLSVTYRGHVFTADLLPDGGIAAQGRVFHAPSGFSLVCKREVNPQARQCFCPARAAALPAHRRPLRAALAA